MTMRAPNAFTSPDLPDGNATETPALDPAARLTPGALARRVFSFPVFLGALLVAGVFMNLGVRLQNDASLPAGHSHVAFLEGDTFWHLAAAQRIWATHTWPTTNYYSFTAPNSQWLDYQWLAEVPMAAASHFGGPRGLMALLAALASAILLLLYCYAYLRSSNVKAALAACIAVWPLLGLCFTLRPQLLGYVFLLIVLIFLERYRQGL